MDKIIIIGTGNIGKRHLQAIAKLPVEFELLCHDADETALKSVAHFCEENSITIKRLRYASDLDEALAEAKDAIVIMATTAKGRKELLCKILASKPKAIIAEKPVAQTIAEYDSILTKADIPIYVNFTRHMYPDYQAIFEKIRKEKDVTFFATAPKIGIACNGIHIIELATWLLQAKTYAMMESHIEKVFETRRKGFFDISGGMTLKLNDRNMCFLEFGEGETCESIDIIGKDVMYKIIEPAEKMTIFDGVDVKVKDFQTIHTSQSTDKVVMDIIKGKTPGLPTLKAAYLAHKIVFDLMKRHGQEKLNIT